MPATYVALKDFTVGKSEYKRGQPVNTDGWPFRRDILLESQRFIRKIASPARKYVSNREGLQIGDVVHKKGQVVNHSGLSQDKLDQLVAQRHLAIDDSEPQQPVSTVKRAAHGN